MTAVSVYSARCPMTSISALQPGRVHLVPSWRNFAALHYVDGDQLFDSVPKGPLWQPTEAGTHPSDLGMASMAEFWIAYLRRLLAIP